MDALAGGSKWDQEPDDPQGASDPREEQPEDNRALVLVVEDNQADVFLVEQAIKLRKLPVRLLTLETAKMLCAILRKPTRILLPVARMRFCWT